MEMKLNLGQSPFESHLHEASCLSLDWSRVVATMSGQAVVAEKATVIAARVAALATETAVGEDLVLGVVMTEAVRTAAMGLLWLWIVGWIHWCL